MGKGVTSNMWEYTFQVTLKDTTVKKYAIVCDAYWKAWIILYDRWHFDYTTLEEVKIVDIQAVS